MNLPQKINELQRKYGDSFFYVYINYLDGDTLEELYLLHKKLEKLNKSQFLQYRIVKITTPDYFQYLVVNRCDTKIIAEGYIFTKDTTQPNTFNYKRGVLFLYHILI